MPITRLKVHRHKGKRKGIWCPRHPDEGLIRIELPDGKFDLRCEPCTQARVAQIKLVGKQD